MPQPYPEPRTQDAPGTARQGACGALYPQGRGRAFRGDAQPCGTRGALRQQPFFHLHLRGIRNRQGDLRAGHTYGKPVQERPLCGGSTVRPCPNPFWKASFSAMPKAPSPARKKAAKSGLFEMAHNGTLFLDEIGEIPHLGAGQASAACSRKKSSCASVRNAISPSTCASCALRTRIWRNWCGAASSGKTFSTA